MGPLGTKRNTVRVTAQALLLVILLQWAVFGADITDAEATPKVKNIPFSQELTTSSSILARLSTEISSSAQVTHQEIRSEKVNLVTASKLSVKPLLGAKATEATSAVEDETFQEELTTSFSIVFSLSTEIPSSSQVTHQDNLRLEQVTLVTVSQPPVKPLLGGNNETKHSATSGKTVDAPTTQVLLSTAEETSVPPLKPQLSPQNDSISTSTIALAPTLSPAADTIFRIKINGSQQAGVLEGTSASSVPTGSPSVPEISTIKKTANVSDLISGGEDDLGSMTPPVSPSSQNPALSKKTTAYSTNHHSRGPAQDSGHETSVSDVSTAKPHPTINGGRAEVTNPPSSATPLPITVYNGQSSGGEKYKHWYIAIAVVILAVLILFVCFIWKVHRKRNTGSTSFQGPQKKKKNGGEDAWAGPVNMPDENGMLVDVEGNEQEPLGKRLTLTTFFNKRKSRQTSVILEDINIQTPKSTKEEAAPLLSQSRNSQVNGNANELEGSKDLLPTGGAPTSINEKQETPSPPQSNGQIPAVQESSLSTPTGPEALLPPPSPPPPPPENDFPAPPRSEMGTPWDGSAV
ncbi:leukosialin [Ambystoma mexicanum]|uniref:leukosialin n=1 Tax=Ambystoma mexicanum TaxID=8296 RepID=UPI0037E883CB